MLVVKNEMELVNRAFDEISHIKGFIELESLDGVKWCLEDLASCMRQIKEIPNMPAELTEQLNLELENLKSLLFDSELRLEAEL